LTAGLDLERVRAVLAEPQKDPSEPDPHPTDTMQAAVAALLNARGSGLI
jgi:hypothetical protein